MRGRWCRRGRGTFCRFGLWIGIGRRGFRMRLAREAPLYFWFLRENGGLCIAWNL